MTDLRVALIQTELEWEDTAANRQHFDQLIDAIAQPTDLIILPEMFTTGFTMQPDAVAESMQGDTIEWMRATAAKTNAVITGSIVVVERELFYNRLVWMRPDGSYATYDKRHLFALAGEHQHYKQGTTRLVTELKGWKICPLICYDLRFPVWSRNTVAYDLLLYVANWPDRRRDAWKSLLVARAIENQCYTIGVNRVGQDANGHLYAGDSTVVDYAGCLLASQSYTAGILQLKLNAQQQHDFRTKLDFLADRDAFSVIP
ncbi:MAG: amidohydrolase [Bacteroidota bacterium]